MPTYEYECKSCGNEWEEIAKITESATTKCPKCKKNKAKRLIGTTSFQLKGGGWGSEGYKSKNE